MAAYTRAPVHTLAISGTPAPLPKEPRLVVLVTHQVPGALTDRVDEYPHRRIVRERAMRALLPSSSSTSLNSKMPTSVVAPAWLGSTGTAGVLMESFGWAR